MGNKPLTPFISEHEIKDEVVKQRIIIILSLKHYYKDIRHRISHLESQGLQPPKYNFILPEFLQAYSMEELKEQRECCESAQRVLVRYEIQKLISLFIVSFDPTRVRYTVGEFWDYFKKNGMKKGRKLAWWRRKKYVVDMAKIEEDPVRLLEYFTVKDFDDN